VSALDQALERLTRAERDALCSAAAAQRDARAAAGQSRMADVWHALACAAADARDRDAELFRALEDDLLGVLPEEP